MTTKPEITASLVAGAIANYCNTRPKLAEFAFLLNGAKIDYAEVWRDCKSVVISLKNNQIVKLTVSFL